MKEPVKIERTRLRRSFDEEFKKNAVQLSVRGDRSVAQVAAELGIRDGLLHRWRARYAPLSDDSTGSVGLMSEQEKTHEIVRLRAELARMHERENVLKKSLGILSEPPERGLPRLKR